MTQDGRTTAAARQEVAGRCPTCGARSVRAFRPFCSRRCADIDLGRWLKGNYRIPTEEAPQEGVPAEELPEERRKPEE